MLIIRRQFAPCSRDFKRLDGITRSPIYSHLTSTTYGLQVIRSYRAEAISRKKFENHLNDNTRVQYLMYSLNRWSAIRFDWLALFFLALVTMLALIMHILQQKMTAADVALTLTQIINLLGLFQWTIRCVDQSSHSSLSLAFSLVSDNLSSSKHK